MVVAQADRDTAFRQTLETEGQLILIGPFRLSETLHPIGCYLRNILEHAHHVAQKFAADSLAVFGLHLDDDWANRAFKGFVFRNVSSRVRQPC